MAVGDPVRELKRGEVEGRCDHPSCRTCGTGQAADHYGQFRDHLTKPDPRIPRPRAPFPAPTHTTRDPVPSTVDKPRAVVSVVALALTHGWTVDVSYARGHTPHSTHGRPGPERHGWLIRAHHPVSGVRLALVSDSPTGRAAWAWRTILIRIRPDSLPYAYASITDIKELIKLQGRALPGWYDRITKHHRTKKEKAK